MEKITFTKDGQTTEVDSTNEFIIGKLKLMGWIQVKK